MYKHISNDDKANYMQILAELNRNNAGICTQKELSYYLRVSVRKISDFQNGLIIDFWLLQQYAGIIGRKVEFRLL